MIDDPYGDEGDLQMFDVNPTSGEAVARPIQARAQDFADLVLAAVETWDQNRPRSKQSEARILGPSEVGGCREYIRATVVGDPKVGGARVNLPAIWGTAIGDIVEQALRESHPEIARTQFDVEYTLHVAGTPILVRGHGDICYGRKILADLKSKDGLTTAEREGGSFKERVQLSIYLLGLITSGELDEDAEAFLIFMDRSGRERRMVGVGITVEQAREYVAEAERRLEAVMRTIASGTARVYRDEPEPYCYRIGCPFYAACWQQDDSYVPQNAITNPNQIEAVKKYQKHRDEKKAAEAGMAEAKHYLLPDLSDVERAPRGVTPDGTTLNWKITDRSGTLYATIDVRP
jgi:hypothetical protein